MNYLIINYLKLCRTCEDFKLLMNIEDNLLCAGLVEEYINSVDNNKELVDIIEVFSNDRLYI